MGSASQSQQQVDCRCWPCGIPLRLLLFQFQYFYFVASRKSLCHPVWDSTLPNPFMIKHYNEWPCWTLICSFIFWGIQIPHLSVVQRNLKSLHLSSSVCVIGAPPMNFQIEILRKFETNMRRYHTFPVFSTRLMLSKSALPPPLNSHSRSSANLNYFCPLKRHGGHSGAHHGPANLAGIQVLITSAISTRIAILLEYTHTLPLVYIESRSELKLVPKLSYNQSGVA